MEPNAGIFVSCHARFCDLRMIWNVHIKQPGTNGPRSQRQGFHVQDILSRRKFLLSGLLFVAGSRVAAAKDGEGTRRFNAQKGTGGRSRERYPDFFEPWEDDYDEDYDRDWKRYDDEPRYGED